ncbi:MAG: multiheme c-type cytochrome [Deltaproteobacteria bacterium]|nr:multiheme c-type cytochrome [Deltaproteobacteria bacterium]
MKRTLVILLAAGVAAAALGAPKKKTPPAKSDCAGCHQKETPGVMKPFSDSAHAGEVSCEACHGESYEANHPAPGAKRRKAVGKDTCGGCHAQATADHEKSAHSIGLRAGSACTRNEKHATDPDADCGTCHEKDTAVPRTGKQCALFLAQSPTMQQQGCSACHAVEQRCDSCHGPHDTDLRIVKDPAVCATCHMGPDHAQWEMWKTSRHGIAWKQLGPERGPDCQRCHMPGGTHDVSYGISLDLAGVPYPQPLFGKRRAEMLDVCDDCHTRAFSARALEGADVVHAESLAMVQAAAAIIEALEAEGLLMPSIAERPAHPLFGKKLELGGHMLYEDLSGVETLYFRMKTFAFLSAFKGAFHQSPDYTHWYGNAPLKLLLSRIRSEAATLRRLKLLEEKLELVKGGAGTAVELEAVEEELRALKALMLEGAIDAATFETRKRAVLEKHGL